MLNIGCHLSTSKGFKNMGETALAIDANTFQFFTRNPRGSRAKKIAEKDLAALLQIMEENNFAPLLAHAPYTLNMCSSKEETREFARQVFADDLRIMEQLPGNLYNFHPGSHVGQGLEKGIEQIVDILNHVMTADLNTQILLETMSGKGTEIGRNFQELQAIIVQLNHPDKIGVCLDTCHVFAAGYDIVNDLDGVINEFDKIIGLEKLYAIHLNDSMTPLGSNKDRHAGIGLGEIGLEAFIKIVNYPPLRNLPFYLETPNDIAGYQREISLLRGVYKQSNKMIGI